ncbi:hypothetical protein C7B80_07265 [Cyanosarcina cf. burmensis CCALA 770]|nr:hypothetical protein C7B80_07265 [Cyanosarcina cf. burmensis CCALA 770]
MVLYPAVKILSCPDIRLSIIHPLLKDFFKDSDFLKKNRSSTINEFFSIYTGNFSQILYAEI